MPAHHRAREENGMASDGWIRRDVIRGVAVAAATLVLPLIAGREAGATGPDSTAPRDREARRRWALARMDEMARERLRCQERFRKPHDIRDCQSEFDRRYRAYNDLYIEMSRE
jgi:hypothetical protein